MTTAFQDVISTEAQLRELMGYPTERARDKVVDRIDKHCRALIEHSPFMLIASSDADGNLDISPKGDPAGFVRVHDEKTLIIPDRQGNRRLDTFSNILRNPKVALFFVVPGYRETLRVTGTAKIVRDTALRESMVMKGKTPDLALVVDVETAFFHCAKCIIRSNLWGAEDWPELEGMPSLAEVLKDHSKLSESVEELDHTIATAYVEKLY